MPAKEPTREEIVSYLVLKEGVTEREANDFLDVLDLADEEEAGSSDEMRKTVREAMTASKLAALLEQIANLDPNASERHVEAVKRVAARAVEDASA